MLNKKQLEHLKYLMLNDGHCPYACDIDCPLGKGNETCPINFLVEEAEDHCHPEIALQCAKQRLDEYYVETCLLGVSDVK